MTPEDRDRELARLFEAERAADEAGAPDLRALFGRPAAPRRRLRTGRVLLRAAAVAIVVLAGARLLRIGHATPTRDRSAGATTTLAEWRSPTEFLLNTPGSEMWTQVPSFGSTAFASGHPPEASPTKGVER